MSWEKGLEVELKETNTDDPYELIAKGKYGRASDLRRNLTYVHLSGRLANLLLMKSEQVKNILGTKGHTIIKKLEKYTANCHFGVVLATPDDIGYRPSHRDEQAYRARQNVVLELGCFFQNPVAPMLP